MDPKQADEVLELTRRNDMRARELLKHLTSSLPDVRNENFELQQQLKDAKGVISDLERRLRLSEERASELRNSQEQLRRQLQAAEARADAAADAEAKAAQLAEAARKSAEASTDASVSESKDGVDLTVVSFPAVKAAFAAATACAVPFEEDDPSTKQRIASTCAKEPSSVTPTELAFSASQLLFVCAKGLVQVSTKLKETEGATTHSTLQLEALQETEAALRAALWDAEQRYRVAEAQLRSQTADIAEVQQLRAEVARLRRIADVLPELQKREKNVEALLSLMLTVQPRAIVDGGAPTTVYDEVLRRAEEAGLLNELSTTANAVGSIYDDPASVDVAASEVSGVNQAHSSVVRDPSAAAEADSRVQNAVRVHPWMKELLNTTKFVPVYTVEGTEHLEPCFIPVSMLQHRVFVMLCRNYATKLSIADPHPFVFVTSMLDAPLKTQLQRLGGPFVTLREDEEVSLSQFNKLVGALPQNTRGMLLYAFADSQKLPIADLKMRLSDYLDPAAVFGQVELVAISERLYVWLAAIVWKCSIKQAERDIFDGRKKFTCADLRVAVAPVWAVLSQFSFPGGDVDVVSWTNFFKKQALASSDAEFLHLMYAVVNISQCTKECLSEPSRIAALTDVGSGSSCIIM